MNITLSELKVFFIEELDHLEEMGYEKIEIPVDYYWNIPQNVRYDPYNKPEDLDLGQLSDDWQELQKTYRDETNPIAYDLVWLSTILRAIGEQIVG